MTLTLVILAFVTLERLTELWLARRNTAALIARGAFEVAPRHYALIVVLHGLWIIGLWWFGWNRPVNLGWLALFMVLQALRIWVLTTLGERWTTRIIILPNAKLVTGGPYRYINHPNYAVVIGEIAALPLALGLPVYALIFSLVNAAVLTLRIREESAALLNLRHASFKP